MLYVLVRERERERERETSGLLYTDIYIYM
jgi:hypothetical protein